MRRSQKAEMKKARILSESGPLRTELGRPRYALPSPGNHESPDHARQDEPDGATEAWVHTYLPLPIGTIPKATRTNAPRPGWGRNVLMTWAGFTVGP